jgi:hypothetical protein
MPMGSAPGPSPLGMPPPGALPMGMPPVQPRPEPAYPAHAARLRPPRPEQLSSHGEPDLPAVPEPPGPGDHPDTWETAPLPPVTDDYEGRRRRRRGGRHARWTSWFVVIGVVLALSAAIGVPFLFAGGGDRNVDAYPSRRTSDPTSTGPSTAVTGLPVIPAPSVADPSASPSPDPNATTAAAPSGSAGTSTGTATTGAQTTTTGANPPAQPAFSVTLQAEQAFRGGGADTHDGVVDHVGRWADRRGWRTGWVEFRNIVVPEPGAQYQVKIWYVFRAQNGAFPPRQIAVTVNNQTVQTTGNLAPTSTLTAVDVTVTLGSGNNTIRLSHLQQSSPAIDRIEITAL